MKIINKEEKQNELLSRKEYTIQLEYEGASPAKNAVKEHLVKELKASDDTLLVYDVQVRFGTNTADVTALVYTDAATMARVESLRMHRKIKEKLEKEAAKAAQAQEQ